MSRQHDDELRALQAALDGGDASALSEEIAKRWDPDLLLKLVARRGGRGQPLDVMTRAKYEKQFGVDLGHVRIYSGEFAERVTKAHRAEAITVGGTGMIFMKGRPSRSPLTAAGRGLLAHELTHVAQDVRGIQRSGDVPDKGADEVAAQREEARAMAESAPSEPQVSPEEQARQLREAIIAHVFELIEENERLWVDRNGEFPIRP
jgi:hypothetical protein